jgi:signal transduction histidine kinase
MFNTMNPSPPSDVSLYELAVNADRPPQLVQLSPTTFKSIVSLFLDFLIEQNLPTQLWLKLPRGEAWQAEIDRFCQLAPAPYCVYSFQTYQKAVTNHSTQPLSLGRDPQYQASQTPAPQPLQTAPAEPVSEWEGTRIQGIGGTEIQDFSFDELDLEDLPDLPSSSAGSSKIRALPLAVDSQLKREYFLLVVSPRFYGLILAHRPRSLRSLEGAGGKVTQLAEDALERKHPLLGFCSFDQALIQRVLEEGINAAISFGQADVVSSTSLQELLVSWEELQQQNAVTTFDPALMGSLLTKQIQCQEDLWHSTANQRRQLEAMPLLQQENQELLNALRVKDEFIKTMGLELRTPLSTMKTAMSLLNSPSLKAQQRQRYMDMLGQECDRQGSLISGVLDLIQLESAVEEAPMESLRLAEIVPGVVSTYQPLAQEKGIMLGYVVPEDLPPVSCLTPWLKQIVINLLHNSIKFTPKGGQVWVRAKQQGESIQLEFRDTGVGIASNDLPRIFERFYRARGSSAEDSTGVGLGLSIVQQLLLRCGGSISVKSKQGEGSVFSVLLPIAQGQ